MPPINRNPDHVREQVKNNLDMVLRAEPAGGHVLNVLQVYSAEINTKENLRELLRRMLDDDVEVDEKMSDSTLQRMINRYSDLSFFSISCHKIYLEAR